MNKATLRKQYLGKRAALSKKIHQEKSEAIAELFFDNISLNNYKSLHTFLPIKKNLEVDTYLIIREVRKRYPKLGLVVPKIQDYGLEHYILAQDTIIAPGPYSVPEPQGAERFEEQQIDIVLVPLLVFDIRGHRIGYGKGYYDRFLAEHPEALKVGLSLFAPVDQIPEVSLNDIALDMIITPDECYRF
ncbi:MAG: 5-formyltetrahydrofolate cyclo-ligase [Cyclobacteriaceae bacterium]